jgi:hypothetical protein
MVDFVAWIEDTWKTSSVLAWVLVLLGFGAVVLTFFFPQSPGVSIGLLACAAGIMSLRPDMHIYEKMAWIVVLISFTVWEIRAINKSDNENLLTLMNQNSQFKQTQTALFWAYELDREGFGSTMNEFSRTNSQEGRRFDALVREDHELYEHEEKLAESLNGSLIPGKEPTPKTSCGDIPAGGALLTLGSEDQHNGSIVTKFPHIVLASRRNGVDSPVVTLDRDIKGTIFVLLDIRSRDGRIIARMDSDGFVVNRNAYLEMKKDKNSLKITDEYGAEVLNVRYLNRSAISVSGVGIGLPKGMSYICSQGAGPGKSDYLLDFKQP